MGRVFLVNNQIQACQGAQIPSEIQTVEMCIGLDLQQLADHGKYVELNLTQMTDVQKLYE